MVPSVDKLKVKIFADGADLAPTAQMVKNPLIAGFTTNPTLMSKAGHKDYRHFSKEFLKIVPTHPVSFEVLSDDFADMERQAREIASWGNNVYVKIPVTNTRGEHATDLIHRLSHAGVKVNVTALMTVEQVQEVSDALGNETPSNISVFAGRIADTGRDPMPIMRETVKILARHPKQELIWASPRELLNVFQADDIGCHIITATHDILKKLSLVGKDLNQYSLETVKMFDNDARTAGLTL